MNINDNIAAAFKGDPSYYFRNGRTFRTFKELNIAASGTYVIKIVLPAPVYFTGFDINIESGQLKVETVTGGVRQVVHLLKRFPSSVPTSQFLIPM